MYVVCIGSAKIMYTRVRKRKTCIYYHCCCEHQLQNFSNPSLIIPHIGCISTQCSNLHL